MPAPKQLKAPESWVNTILASLGLEGRLNAYTSSEDTGRACSGETLVVSHPAIAMQPKPISNNRLKSHPP